MGTRIAKRTDRPKPAFLRSPCPPRSLSLPQAGPSLRPISVSPAEPGGDLHLRVRQGVLALAVGCRASLPSCSGEGNLPRLQPTLHMDLCVRLAFVHGKESEKFSWHHLGKKQMNTASSEQSLPVHH